MMVRVAPHEDSVFEIKNARRLQSKERKFIRFEAYLATIAIIYFIMPKLLSPITCLNQKSKPYCAVWVTEKQILLLF